jgi:protein-export membrane protein SecD
VTTGTGNLRNVGQDLSSTLGVTYFDEQPVFVTSLPKGLEGLANRQPGDQPIRVESSIQTTVQGPDGGMQLAEIKGIYIAQLLSGRQPSERVLQNPPEAFAALRDATPADTSLEQKQAVQLTSAPAYLQQALSTMEIGSMQAVKIDDRQAAVVYLSGRVEGQSEMTASHILMQYKGASRADATVTRSKEEALAKIRDIKGRVNAQNFNQIASTESDGPSKGQAGSLGVITQGMMVPEFESVAFALQQGQISDVVETAFGYHIIRADKALSTPATTVSYDLLTIKAADAAARVDSLQQKVLNGEVKRMEDQVVIRGLFLSLQPTGWQDTELNGEHFLSAAVTTDNLGLPEVQIQFDEEGGKLFQELTKRNVNKQIAIFVGGELVSAPSVSSEIVGQSAVINGVGTFENARRLAQDLNTGAIPAPVYLAGQSTVEATLGADALAQSVFAGAVGLALLALVMVIVYRMLGVAAVLALAFCVILFVAALKLPVLLVTKQYVVLTLAGIAGIILSIGMAVDANVLVFERIKEEMKKGKTFKTSLDVGFKRAWPSIRDGNVSTLITAAILFTIGTSIIRGFSVTLVMGLIISLFTALVVTRWISSPSRPCCSARR